MFYALPFYRQIHTGIELFVFMYRPFVDIVNLNLL